MDPHPTPFPGKLRPSANTKKEKGEGKSSREASRVTAVASRHRQGRAFGTVRSTNVTVDRPPQEQTKAFKQLKPSGVSKKLPNRDGSTVELKKEPTASHEDAKDAVRKPKPETKRSSVRFQEQQPPPEKGCTSKGVPEEGPRTPMSSIKPAVLLGTPYHSAQSCIKCRFDRLGSAPYWLTQIKLAESVGKHFVSAAFFRLAFECNAEPIRSLRSELKRYMARHGSLHIVTAWKVVCRDYGLLNGEPGVGVNVFDPVDASLEEKQDLSSVEQLGLSGDSKDGCLGCECGDIPQSDLLKEDTSKNADSSFVELNSNIGENPSSTVIGDGANEGVRIPTVNACGDNLMKDKADDSNTAYHCGDKDSSVVTTDGKNFLLEKPERGSSVSPNGSSMRKKVQLRSLAGRSGMTAGKLQAEPESCGEGTGESKDEAKRNQKSKEGAKKNQNYWLKSASNVDDNSIKMANEMQETALLGSYGGHRGSL